MKKGRIRAPGIKVLTASEKKSLKKRAQMLADDPGILIPDCDLDCRGCPFKKMEARLNRIRSQKNNHDALKKLGKSGSQMERAYAVALSILKEKEMPTHAATVRLPNGDFSYVIRGNVKKEYLVGVQHFNEPRVRLFAYADLGKKNYHIYSTKDKLICTGRSPSPPAEFIDFAMSTLKYKLTKKGDLYQCAQSSPGKGKKELIFSLRGSKIEIRVDSKCAEEKVNLLTGFAQYIMCKDPIHQMDIDLEIKWDCAKEDGCTLGDVSGIPNGILRDYTDGKFSDKELMEKAMDSYMEDLLSKSHTYYIIGAKCFEDDMAMFIDALGANKVERKALLRVLEGAKKPVFTEQGTPSSVLSQFWDDDGMEAIDAVIDDKKMAKEIFEETKDKRMSPSQILHKANDRKKESEVLSSIPTLKNLSPLGNFADSICRRYRVSGTDEVIRLVEQNKEKGTRFRSMGCAFLMATDSIGGREWQFSKEEKDYGTFIKEYAEKALNCASDEYQEAVRELLVASGES